MDIEYKGYTINMVLLGSNPHTYFPQILLKGKWIHEFMWSWDDKEKAIEAAKEFVDHCDGTPTTDAQLFAEARNILNSRLRI